MSTCPGVRGKHGGIKFVPWDKITFPRLAAKEVRWDRIAEFDRGAGALFAEQNHVGKVGIFVIWEGCFAEDAARWEDGRDGADGETGRVEI